MHGGIMAGNPIAPQPSKAWGQILLMQQSAVFYNLSLWVIFRSSEHWEAASCLEDRKSWRRGWVVTQRTQWHFVEGQPLSPQPILKQSMGEDVFVKLGWPFLLVAWESFCWHSRNQKSQDAETRGGWLVKGHLLQHVPGCKLGDLWPFRARAGWCHLLYNQIKMQMEEKGGDSFC